MADTSVITIGPVRFSFLRVFKPELNEINNRQEYSGQGLIPKEPNEFCPDPEAVLKMLRDKIKEVATEKFGAKMPPNFKSPLKDGDVELTGEGEPRVPGHYFFKASKANMDYPLVLKDGKLNDVGPADGWDSGDWGRIQVKVFAYDAAGNRGVALGLRGIQFLKHDDHFGGAAPFDVVEDSDATGTPKNSDDEFDPFAN